MVTKREFIIKLQEKGGFDYFRLPTTTHTQACHTDTGTGIHTEARVQYVSVSSLSSLS